MLLVTEKSAVPIITGKEPASNPVLTTVSPVTEVSRLQRIDGDKLVGQEVSSVNFPLTNWLQSLQTEYWFTQPSLTVASQDLELLVKYSGTDLCCPKFFVTERHHPTGLTSYRACWLQRKAAEPPLWTGKSQLNMSISLLRSSSVHPVLPPPVSLCRTVEPPGTGYRALLHI